MKSAVIFLAVLLCLLAAALAPSGIRADEGSANVTLKVTVVSEPWVMTTWPVGINLQEATLCGWLFHPGSAPSVTVNFGWDTVSHAHDPSAYRNWTTPQVKTKPGPFSTRISGLTPGTVYYFRARAVGDVTSYGEELSFMTPPRYYWWNWWWYWWWHW